MFSMGQYVELKDGLNFYQIIEVSGGLCLLVCEGFVCPDDLGDEIWCTRENQRIWVAMGHHGYKFQDASYRLEV